MRITKKHHRWQALVLCLCILAGMLSFEKETFAEKAKDSERAQNSAASPDNALSDEAYGDFGFQSLPEQEAFSSSEHPLDGFEGAAMSQLYVGYMNKDKSQKGRYAVYNTMPRRSKQGATISGSGSSGYLDAAPVSPASDYADINVYQQVEKGDYRTLNTVSLDMGSNSDGSGGKRAVICESILLTGKERNVAHAKTTSWLCIRTLVNAGNGYTPANTRYVKLANADTSIGSVDVRAAQGLNAAAAGDYDGDGMDELAVYVPNFAEPYIQLYKIGEDGSIAEGAKIVLNELAAPDDPWQYRFSFSGWNLPIVNLTTATLSREVTKKDSLVISACLPRSEAKTYKGRSQLPALAIYEENGGSMKRTFLDHLSYGDYYMRFPAAVEADLNASKTDELVVAGYADTWRDPNNQELKDHPFQKYCVNMLVYDEDAKSYQMTYSKPLEYTPGTDVKKVMDADSGYAMSEPVALTAADLSEVTDNDYLFLEGALLSFREGPDVKKDDTELKRLLSGSLFKHTEMSMKPSKVTVSHAVSGRLAADRAGSEQIALVWNDNYNHPNAVVDGNITWIWMENNVPVQHDTNYQYLKGRDADGSGTFLSLAKVDDTANRAVYRYKEKSYGWSAPNALMSLPAVPHWKELPYENGVGDVFFSVGNELEAAGGADMGMSMGITGSVSAMAGAGALGNKIIGGLGLDFDASVEESVHLQLGLSVGNTQTYSAPGDKNHVLAYATPMVTYKYEVWLPAFEVTEETAQKYKELTNSDVLKNEDGTVYSIGDTVPAGWYSYNMHVPYSPTYTLITMDQYNEAYTKHKLGTGEIDMSAYDFTVGDPTTYKNSFSDIPHYNNVAHMKSRPKDITANDVDNGIEFDAGASVGGSATVGLQVSGAVQGKIEAEANFFGAGKIEGSFGQSGGFESSITGEANFNFSIGAGATINHLPAGYGDYSFQTTMGVWPCIGNGALLTTGFIVNPKTDIPPAPPKNPYVYETGMQKNGKAFLVLAWEQPASTDYRLAKEYEVFYKNTGASAVDYTSAGKAEALKQNFMLITGLEPGNTYDFAFKAISERGHDGGISKPLTVTMAAASTLSIDPSKPLDVYEEPTGGLISSTLEVKAQDTDPNNAISYQWQRYEAAEGYLGEWSDVPGATASTYDISLPEAEADGAKYRCAVTSRPKNAPHSAYVQRVVSRAATVHNGTDPRFSVSLTAQGAGGSELPRESAGAYFLPAGAAVTLKAEVVKKDAAAIGDGTVSFFYRKDGGTETKLTDGITPSDGEAAYEWSPEETGRYELIAVYTAPGGTIRSIDEEQGTGQEPSAAELAETPEGESEETEMPEGESEETDTPESGPEETETPEGGPEETEIPENEPQGAKSPKNEPEAAPQSETEPAGSPLVSSAQKAVNIAVSEPVSIHVGTIRDEVYFIRYELSGGKNSTANPHAIGKNAATHVLEPPARTGASFDGWYEDEGFTSQVTSLDPEHIKQAISGEGNTYVLYAKWTAAEYSVTYELDGGANHPDNPDKYTLMDGITLREPEKAGYRFKGWYFEESSPPGEDVDKSTPVYSLPLLDKKGDWVDAGLTLSARWEIIEYPITYHTLLAKGKGENPDTYTVEDTVVLKDADYEGYMSHGGWYTDRDFANPIKEIGPGTTGHLTLYTKPESSGTYIWYNTLGGVYEGVNPQMMLIGTAVNLGLASRQGFDFETWSEEAVMVDGEWVADVSDPSKTHEGYTMFTPPKIFNTLYAAWTPSAGQVEIHWLNPANGEEIYLNYGVKGNQIADPGLDLSYYGYKFDGKWYKDKELKKPWDFDRDVIPEDIEDKLTLYAGLREVYYRVAFETNGAETVPEQQVQAGKSAVKPEDPAIQNQIFLGWYEDKACTIPYDFTSEVQSDITLYAGWRGREPVKPNPDDNQILGIEDGRKYAIGSVLDFTAVGAGMENAFPIEGDERYIPKSWSVNPSGTWSQAPYAASFETKDMAIGAHALAVAFGLERYEDGVWKDTGDTAEAKVSFELTEDKQEPTPPEPGMDPSTGDKNDLWIWALLAAAAFIGSIALIILKRRGKKKRRR
ncbi:InlB B-repeat-containing protein [Extibacter muris]|uniref:InlB B-repeat-containing protein n=1 Tax=Extibacter muris TaxID=1796622 RepID=UPI001D06B4F2|nr:InlB B-repeat-containing protein [Extibacter muris]MCB6202987.1 InlB B-repeat-containing protein [Extibacter muris]MCQ4664030.1 InlB B-repeat-containing protein [Extibacter muris]MCQ4693336.1 InlB B-repeat-containing protein [Extibacter muris]